ncbi:MAG: DNA polymerase III subunit epsilon [Pseudohongiellaceae bacterium]
MRQIVLDTETTGLEPEQGHRIIEIGCVELDNRRLTDNRFHCYLNPERDIDAGAVEIHGLTNEFLADKPVFSQVVDEFLNFVRGAELIIHNAPFDVGFINSEITRLAHGRNGLGPVDSCCEVIDTLSLARQKHPGQRNSLDALCKRYAVDNSQRVLHGALLDAEILADVYLVMTGGQTRLMLGGDESVELEINTEPRRLDANRKPLRIVRATAEELKAHAEQLAHIASKSGAA